MPSMTLGRTGIRAERNGFGALPIQRVQRDKAVYLLKKALDHGIHFFDTARTYSDSEEKLGLAFAGDRQRIFLATKTPAKTSEAFWQDLETSLSLLKTDYIDVYQFHNPAFCPRPGDESGLYEAMLEAKQQGKVRFIGITNHRLSVGLEAVQSGLYDVLQYPLSYLSTDKEEELARLCAKTNTGFLAMKALSGGLITHAAAAAWYLSKFEQVMPIWGIQREAELDEFIRFIKEPPVETAEIRRVIAQDRERLSGSFCRGCGYCMPCPAGIEINMCARMALMIRRAPSQPWLSQEWQEKMARIESCMECGQCRKKCPYELEPSALLKENLRDYQEILMGKA